MGFALGTESCDARGLSTGFVSSCYRDGARGLRRPNEIVIFDVAVIVCLCPFPSALASFLFFRDASDPLRYLLTRTRRMWNVLVYAFCVILGVVPVTYNEQRSATTKSRRVENPHSSRVGARGDGGQILKVLLSRCCRRLENDEASDMQHT